MSEIKQLVKRRRTFSAMADYMGVSISAVSRWFKEGRHIPAERVLEVEKFTGISRRKLRPDLYP